MSSCKRVNDDYIITTIANGVVGGGNVIINGTLIINGDSVISGSSGSGESNNVTIGSGVTEIDRFQVDKYGSAKYMIVAKTSDGSARTGLESLVVHDGTTARISSYGVINTGSTQLVVIDAVISYGYVVVRVTGQPNTVVAITKTYIP